MATTVNPDRDPDDPLPTSIPTASCQFYDQMVEELATHARQWLGTSSSQSGLFFTVEELDTLLIKNRHDGKNDCDIVKLLQTKTENKTKTDELVQLYYYQSRLTYQLRIEQQLVTKGVESSPTQLDIDTSKQHKQQELESVKELINEILLRRTTDTDTTTTTKSTVDLLNVDSKLSTLGGSTPSTLDGTTSAMNTSSTPSTPSTPSTSSNSNELKKTNVIHETMVLLPLTQSTVQLLINFFESVQRTFTIESIRSINTGSNMPTEDQLGKSATNPSPSYNIVEGWKDGKLIQVRLNKLKYYRFGR